MAKRHSAAEGRGRSWVSLVRLSAVLRRESWLAAVLAALLLAPAAAFAAGSGAIDGQLVDKTPGATLQAGGKAYVYKLVSGQDPQQAGQVDVDASGHFRFDSLDADPASSYEVGVQYQGAPYFSDPLTFAPGETTKTITIVVVGDSRKEADETFYLDLFGNSSNSLFTKNRGLGTILNDD